MTNQFFGSLPEYDLTSEKQLSEVSIYDLSVELLSRFQHNVKPGNIPHLFEKRYSVSI